MTIRALLVVILALGAVFAACVDVSSAADEPDVTNCAQSRSVNDLNGDGYVDAVVGDPYATVQRRGRGRHSDGAVRRRRRPDRRGRAPGVDPARPRRDSGDRGPLRLVGQHVPSSISTVAVRPDHRRPGRGRRRPRRCRNGPCLHDEPAAEGEEPTRRGHHVDQSDVGGTVEAGDEFGFSVAATDCATQTTSYGVPNFRFGAPGENDDAGVVNGGDLVGAAVSSGRGPVGCPAGCRPATASVR